MSEVKVNKISPRSGTGVQLGDSGDTITIPSGATILNSGTASGFGDNLEWQSSIVTAATITVVANRGYWLDTSSNAITVTLPAAAAVGDRIILTDYARNWATNAVTINTNSLKFQGNTSPNPVYNSNGQSVDIVYSGTTKGWIPNSDDVVSLETPQTFAIEYVVIAGGGGGGFDKGGGGGAGGYRASFNSEASGGGASSESTPYSSETLGSGTTYTVTVGDGANGSNNSNAPGGTGQTSTLTNGSTAISCTGGGGGGTKNVGYYSGENGGSGGGTSTGTPASVGNGTANQGFAGGGASSNSGGGGGAGSVGLSEATGDAAGGAGVASTITGPSVLRAGGGGGFDDPGGTAGTGGGGTGGSESPAAAATAGTVNTGGGGGGGSGSGAAGQNGGNGGKGVVIISMPDASYSGTTTGSPTVATGVGGSRTVITFNASGTYVA